jgi:type VI secretion system protein ImpH
MPWSKGRTPRPWNACSACWGLPQQAQTCQALEPFALLRYLGLFGLASRPAEGLRALLADHFEEPSIQVVPCVERTVPIPEEQRCQLGQANHQLGVEACLGSTVQDRMGKFRVEIGPLDADGLQRFLPGGTASREMAELIRLYCRDSLAWELLIKIQAVDSIGARLGSSAWSRLGLDAWLAAPQTAPAVTAVTFQGAALWNPAQAGALPSSPSFLTNGAFA